MDRPPRAAIFDNDDILVRLMEFLGPRHACIGIGSTCRDLRRLSRDDSLWRTFWDARCLLLPPRPPGRRTPQDFDVDVDVGVGPHGAALVFRRAMREMNLDPPPPADVVPSPTIASMYEAYVQVHIMMKLTNLRVGSGVEGRIAKRDVVVERSNLIAPPCTQTWPGRLSAGLAAAAAAEEEDGGIIIASDNDDGVVTCLNPAEAWCDDPSCDRARCGPLGCCARCYRFSHPGMAHIPPWRVHGEGRNDQPLTFARCSWCSVSFCNEHGSGGPDGYFGRRHGGGGGGGGRSWYECDECNLSSCPDCVSQVFLSIPNASVCRVVTAGVACRRNVCAECVWRVGREKRPFVEAGNVPGGEYGRRGASSSDIVTARGVELLRRDGGMPEWEECETCCSRCLRHVEFRWKELAHVQESFRGFMP